jgi:glycosyltransferase involved in cell wall biosynthesis
MGNFVQGRTSMRVALLAYNAPSGDAIGNQVAEKLAFFLERGADVRVFLESDQRLHPAVENRGARIEEPGSKFEDREESWDFLKSADLILVDYSQYYALLDWLPLLAGGKARIVFDYHGVTPPHLWGDFNLEAIEKGSRRRGLVWFADAAWVHSRFAQRELLDATGFPEAWVRRLGFPVDLERFSPGSPRLDWRQRLGLGPVKLMLFVGRVAPNKRVSVLVEAIALLKERTPAVHAVVVGDTTDIYVEEAQRCRERSAALGVCDRVHFLGRLSEEDLLDAYRSADLFVMPSGHEGFCIPVLEAMACCVPVVAARAAALPETVASAGLTFVPDDAADLARQVLRVLTEDRGLKIEHRGSRIDNLEPDRRTGVQITRDNNLSEKSSIFNPRSSILSLRVAFVAFRFGTGFVGGAESSLGTAARALRDRGHHVEMFTTCTRSEGRWTNELPDGTSDCDGMSLHRFRIDPHDRDRHLQSVRKVLQSGNQGPPEVEEEYLKHSIHSTRLIEELGRRQEEFDAIVVGPYLHGLTCDVAREFTEKAIVVPCFHDEPFAHFQLWPTVYSRAGGIWYHSEEEKRFAEDELGLNHPGGLCIGTCLNTETIGDARRGRELVGGLRPYLVYCGRFSQEKDLPTLLDFAQRYSDAQPARFTFAFLGEGSIKIPEAEWAKNVGFVDDSDKRDILAGAAALVQLSRFESLSLVALEAWAQGTPVLADRRCAVLAGHLDRCGGGRAIDFFESFAAALDDLWNHPKTWQTLGQQGQDYVRKNYGCQQSYVSRLEQAIHDLKLPLAERMRRQGLERARLYSRSSWRERMAELVEGILDGPCRPRQDHVEVIPRTDRWTVSTEQDTILVPVRIANRGTHAVASEGPGRCLVEARVSWNDDGEMGQRGDTETRRHGDTEKELSLTTPLPDLLMPGRTLPAAVQVPVPRRAGAYRVRFQMIQDKGSEVLVSPLSPDSVSVPSDWLPEKDSRPVLGCSLDVEDRPAAGEGFGPLLDEIRAALVEASRLQHLPDDYVDVTEGRFAKWKRWIKRKLLGNFKHAYVDVLSRQQSRFNQQVLTALTELADYCATLEHAAKSGIRNQELGSRGEEPEVRSQRSEARDPRSDIPTIVR